MESFAKMIPIMEQCIYFNTSNIIKQNQQRYDIAVPVTFTQNIPYNPILSIQYHKREIGKTVKYQKRCVPYQSCYLCNAIIIINSNNKTPP